MVSSDSNPSWLALSGTALSLSHQGSMHTRTLQQVRDLIRDKFQVMGVDEESQVTESILIQDGYYCGRRFCRDGVQAIWFVEEGQVKFYCREGTVVEVCSPTAALEALQEKAA